MPLHNYGVLIGRALDRRREGGTDTPHYQIKLGSAGADYRIAVNVLSKQAPSELLYLVDDDFKHPLIAGVTGLGEGWHPLPSQPGGSALDFIRGNLFDPGRMRPLPPDVTGPDNDLADVFDLHVGHAIADPDARVFAFGERWGPETGKADKVFKFSPGNGVHDIHMNQGNGGQFKGDNGVWQDGGLLIHFPGSNRWIGVFLAFQSQAWHTDDQTGHPITTIPGPGPIPEPEAAVAAVRVLAALVNPTGPAPEAETVLLLNASPQPVDLTGWQITDRNKAATALPAQVLPAGATLSVLLSTGKATLGNKGGQITLVNADGLKVHGVSYIAADAKEGWTVVFR